MGDEPLRPSARSGSCLATNDVDFKFQWATNLSAPLHNAQWKILFAHVAGKFQWATYLSALLYAPLTTSHLGHKGSFNGRRISPPFCTPASRGNDADDPKQLEFQWVTYLSALLHEHILESMMMALEKFQWATYRSALPHAKWISSKRAR